MQRVRRIVLSACVLALTQAAPAVTGTHDPVRLVPLSATKLDHCERSGLLRPICPRLVPHVGAAYLSHLSVELSGLRPELDVFGLERGGEYPGAPERNAPPRMGHVVAVAGNVERLASFREPRDDPANDVRDGLVRRSRPAPLSFGRVRWGGRYGALYLMPSFPRGGMLGNHLVFSWRQDGRPYALSLHAWEPLTQSVATLEAMVAGLPSVAAAARLAKLSPVRRLALPRGRATVRATVPAPHPPQHAFDVLVVAPERADVAVEIATPSGHRLRIVESTRTECRARRPLRTCFLHFPRLEAVRGGRWTIVVTKRSVAPARVRVDVSFSR